MAGRIELIDAGAVVAELAPAGTEIGDGEIGEGSIGLVVRLAHSDSDATVLTGTVAEVRGAVVRIARVLGAEVSAQMGICKTCAALLPSWAVLTDWGSFCSAECEQADR